VHFDLVFTDEVLHRLIDFRAFGAPADLLHPPPQLLLIEALNAVQELQEIEAEHVKSVEASGGPDRPDQEGEQHQQNKHQPQKGWMDKLEPVAEGEEHCQSDDDRQVARARERTSDMLHDHGDSPEKQMFNTGIILK
jgi:hypothetical protein